MRKFLLVLTAALLVGCTATAPAAAPVTAPTPTVSSFAGLTAERYALGSSLPDDSSPLSSALYEKRSQWHGTLGPQVDQYNRLLAPFGYRIIFVDNRDWGHPVYTLYKDGKVVAETLDGIYSLSVSPRGDDFALVAESRSRPGPVLIRPGQDAAAWDMNEHEYTTPVFAGTDPITVKRDPAAETNTIPGITAFTVFRGRTGVYSTQLPRDKIPNPVKGLGAWQDHWVLELDDDVLIDGKSLKAERGYDAVFNWRLVAGKPFYFATKGKKTSAVYDGQTLPEQYDEVPHYRCCSAGMYNAGGNEFMVWFYGRQGDQWSYVEMGRY